MTPAEFRDAVLAEWKASPEDSMGPSLDRVLARMLEQAFWRGVCAERAACSDETSKRYYAAAVLEQVPIDLCVAVRVSLAAMSDLASAFAYEADVHRAWAGEV